MVLLRRVIGDALRARRQGQHRTLREVSTAANVSLGYLSEIERGQKEASSELLAAICEALGARLSELLGEVSDTLSLAEEMPDVLAPVDEGAVPAGQELPAEHKVSATAAEPGVSTGRGVRAMAADSGRRVATDGKVTVSVRHEAPLKATLRTTRKARPGNRDRDVIYAA